MKRRGLNLLVWHATHTFVLLIRFSQINIEHLLLVLSLARPKLTAAITAVRATDRRARMLSASGTRLPVKCQLPALRARATSRRIRTHVAILLALYTGWASFQIIGSISNAARESNDAFARERQTVIAER